MDLNICNGLTKKVLNQRLSDIEMHLKGDCFVYYGQINLDAPVFISKLINEIASENVSDHLIFILTTGGGSILAVERIVNIIRHHYNKVSFIIPDYAYSAGTVLCMSGDEIFMNYFSVLGPIDPQVQTKDGRWVSALGYLDKVEELLAKSRDNTITPVEFTILRDMDLGELSEYERAETHSIEILKDYLVKYKFKNWAIRESSKKPVSDEYKNARADDIASRLGSTEWYSHGRPINIEKLEEMGVKISNYSSDAVLSKIICDYYFLLEDYIRESNVNNEPVIYVHTRRYL